MASGETVRQIIDYYRDLLIIQYANKPKARATIELFIQELLSSGILFDVRDAYNVDTAVGVQLDVIGKYVGVDRFFTVNDPIDYFSFTDYVEVDPDSEEKWGFTDYAGFNDYQYNGTLNYNSVLSVDNRLNDDDFRVIIKLKILQNNINHSHKSIDDGVFKFFGTSVRPDSAADMQMVYFISEDVSAIIAAATTKKILPRPMGVGLTLIENVSAEFFGYATYANLAPFHTAGYATYADYATKEGNYLVYNQITVV
jgi:hypothetical protein